MTSTLLSDAGKLRRRLDELQKLSSSGAAQKQVDRGELIEALAEGSFRLALAPSTPPAEAFDLLARAFRLDGTNPKYAYHLARLYLSYGLLDPAKTWLRVAGRLAPTNHRIWIHISLLQKELNATYKGDNKYEPDELLHRSEKIIQDVIAGNDAIQANLADFTPPVSLARSEQIAREGKTGREGNVESHTDDKTPGKAVADEKQAIPLKRLTNPNQCRWTGVYDQSVEGLLEGLPTQAILSKLVPLLEKVAGLAETRNGGTSAFVILAIQWIISNYPIEPVEEIRQRHFAEQDGAALQLLDRVCVLYRLDEKELPAALADALKNNLLSPTLAAMIHQRRLLWAPLEFRSLSNYREANGFLKQARQAVPLTGAELEEQQKKCGTLAHQIDNAIAALHPEWPVPLKYKPVVSDRPAMDAATFEQTLNRLAEAARLLADLRGQAFDHLRTGLEPVSKNIPDEGAYSQAVSDHKFYAALIDSLDKAGQTGLTQLNEFISSSANLDPVLRPLDFEQRKEGCHKGFSELSNLGNFKSILNKVEKRLTLAGELFHSIEKAPSPGLVLILENINHVFSEQAAAPVAGTAQDTVQSLLAQAETSAVLIENSWSRLKELIELHKNGGLNEEQINEGAKLAQVVVQELTACDQRLLTLQARRTEGQISPDSVGMLDQAEQKFRGVIARRGPFLKNFQKLPKPSLPQKAGTPAAPASGQGQEADNTAASQNPSENARQLLGVELVEQKMKDFDREIDQMYQAAEDTLAPYTETARRSAPFLALWMMIKANQAEMAYRTGRYQKARQIWHAMLVKDRLDVNIMKNLALCDSRAPDIQMSLSTWQSYAELLYSHDIVAASPRPNARQRATFHRAFADAYGPASLPGEYSAEHIAQWNGQVDHSAFITFFASPTRVRSFVDHKMLEFLNSRLDFKSPLLILGLSRAEGIRVKGGSSSDEKARREAALAAEPVQKVTAFLDAASGTLPRRVRPGFKSLCLEKLQQAAVACATPERVSTRNDPAYDLEEPQAAKWVQEIVVLKFKFNYLFQNEHFVDDLVQHMNSVDFLDELLRLDQIPGDLSESYLRLAIAHLPIKPGAEFPLSMQEFCDIVLNSLLRFIFIDQKGSNEALRKQQYQRLVDSWVQRPILKPLLDTIDDPQFVYAEQLKPLMADIKQGQGDRQKRAISQAVGFLEGFVKRYPELSGPATVLVNFLDQIDQPKRALEILDQIIAKGFNQSVKPSLVYRRLAAYNQLAEQEIKARHIETGLDLIHKMEKDADFVLQESADATEKKNASDVRIFRCTELYKLAGKIDAAYENLEKIPFNGLSDMEKSSICFAKAKLLYEIAHADHQAGNKKNVRGKLENSRKEAQRCIEFAEDQNGQIVQSARQIIENVNNSLEKI